MSCSGAQQPEGLSGGGLSWLRTDKDAEREGSLDTEALAGNLRLTRDLDWKKGKPSRKRGIEKKKGGEIEEESFKELKD